MAGYIKVEAEKLEVQAINTKINAEIFEQFQKKCKQRNLQMCTVIEAFARQYANGRYILNETDILKWEDNTDKTSILNTPINKDVYCQFKEKVKSNGYYVKYVLTAFIEDYAQNDLILEFVSARSQNNVRG